MGQLHIKYRTYGKAHPPRPIRIRVPEWGGLPQKMRDGSEPQPWHCLPFAEGSMYGLELVYEFENECHVINDDGRVRLEWDYATEPDCALQGSEFITFFPKEASKYYAFNTSVDLVPPPGHSIRTEPHPRYFTDDSGTVPLAMIGNVQSEWWPKKFFVVFRVPPPGGRHIFRRGEPYVQLLFVPTRVSYRTARMSDQEESSRRELEQAIVISSLDIATNVWRNPAAYAFSDYYKVLARAFEGEGTAGVERTVRDAVRRRGSALPADRDIAECLADGEALEKQRNWREAFALYSHVLDREPANAEAAGRMGRIAAAVDKPTLAIELLSRAAASDPNSVVHHANLGELLRRNGRLDEAEAALRQAVALRPEDPRLLSNLGLTLSERDRLTEASDLCRAAARIGPHLPIVHYRLGLVLARQGDCSAARESFLRALELDPNLEDARRAIETLPN